MFLDTIEIPGFYTNCYVIACEDTLEAAVIDPGGEAASILQLLKSRRLKLSYIINTHGHIDHIAADGELKEATGAKLLIHVADAQYLVDGRRNLHFYFPGTKGQQPAADRTLQEGDIVTLGASVRLLVVHTPGHTPGGICLVGDGIMFTGDTLFAGSIGRTDLPGGSYELLIKSIKEKVLAYPDQTIIYPGHGPSSTLGREKVSNPFLV